MNLCDSVRRKFQRTRSDKDHKAFNKQRKKNNISVRKAKQEHHKRLLKDSFSYSRKFRKKFFPTNEKSISAKTFVIDDISFSKPSNIASKFCCFFYRNYYTF